MGGTGILPVICHPGLRSGVQTLDSRVRGNDDGRDARTTGDCFAALAMTISEREAESLLGGYSSTGKQNDVILAE
jgi:hypothetical protein